MVMEQLELAVPAWSAGGIGDGDGEVEGSGGGRGAGDGAGAGIQGQTRGQGAGSDGEGIGGRSARGHKSGAIGRAHRTGSARADDCQRRGRS